MNVASTPPVKDAAQDETSKTSSDQELADKNLRLQKFLASFQNEPKKSSIPRKKRSEQAGAQSSSSSSSSGGRQAVISSETTIRRTTPSSSSVLGISSATAGEGQTGAPLVTVKEEVRSDVTARESTINAGGLGASPRPTTTAIAEHGRSILLRDTDYHLSRGETESRRAGESPFPESSSASFREREQPHDRILDDRHAAGPSAEELTVMVKYLHLLTSTAGSVAFIPFHFYFLYFL
jgi:hypothetical protein